MKKVWLFDSCDMDSLERKIGHRRHQHHHQINTMRHNRRRLECPNPFSHWLWCLVLIMIYFLSSSQIDAQIMLNSTMRLTIPRTHNYKGSRYTIDELINGKFTFKVSDDIDMDPCKASTYNFFNKILFCLFVWVLCKQMQSKRKLQMLQEISLVRR